MAIKKNVASQKLAVYAYDPTTAAGTDPSKTGDAANISAQISLDGGASAATNDVAPTELDAVDHPGVYIFDLTQAETNAEMILLSAVSSTSNILLDPIQVLTEPEKVTLADTAHGGTAATLTMERMIVASTTGNEPALKLTGSGAGAGLHAISPSGPAILAYGSTGGMELACDSRGSLVLDGSLAAPGLAFVNTVPGAFEAVGTDWADGGRLDLLVDAIKAKTDDLTFTVANQVDASLPSGALAMFATVDTGETSGVAGSVVKLAQGAALIGAGSIEKVITVDDGTDPLEGVAVWISTDIAGTNIIAGTIYTNVVGQATFLLDAGSYYTWKQLSGYTFTNPETLTVA